MSWNNVISEKNTVRETLQSMLRKWERTNSEAKDQKHQAHNVEYSSRNSNLASAKKSKPGLAQNLNVELRSVIYSQMARAKRMHGQSKDLSFHPTTEEASSSAITEKYRSPLAILKNVILATCMGTFWYY